MDQIYVAYSALRRYDYAQAIAISCNLLKQNPNDQYALLLKIQAETESSYFDESEFEQNQLQQFQDQIDEEQIKVAQNLQLKTSYRPSSRLQTGYVRPLTAALGRPITKSSSRLYTTRIQTARLQTQRRTASMTRMGTATVKQAYQSNNIPQNYGAKPLFGRIYINYYLRLLPNNPSDVTPDPIKALNLLTSYAQDRALDWFYYDRAARAMFLLGNYEKAEHLLQSALRCSPREETVIKSLQAITCYGKIKQAIQLSKDYAKNEFYSSQKLQIFRAQLEELISDGQSALEAYAQCLEIEKNNFEALAGAAALVSSGYYSKFSEKDAVYINKKLLLFQPQNPSIWNNLGVSYLKDDLIGDAFTAFLTALELQKEGNQRELYAKSDIYNNIGLTFLKTGDFYAASDAFTLATLINQTNADAYVNLGVLASKSGDKRRALALFYQAVQVDEKCDIGKQNLAKMAIAVGKTEKAFVAAEYGDDQWRRVVEKLL